MTDPVRLAKRVVDLLHCSRSEASHYIEDGWVRVDGIVVEKPQHEVRDEKVEVDPDARLTPAEPATILVHKPSGTDASDGALALVIATARWALDTSGVRTLQRHHARLTPVLPLEASASGLAVLTQDRRVSQRMDEEGSRIEQELIAEVTGEIAAGGLERLARGLTFEGRALPPIKVSWQNENRLRFALKAPRPGQIAHMCKEVGLQLVGLKRIRIGRIPLLKMPPGEWRYLPVSERFLLSGVARNSAHDQTGLTPLVGRQVHDVLGRYEHTSPGVSPMQPYPPGALGGHPAPHAQSHSIAPFAPHEHEIVQPPGSGGVPQPSPPVHGAPGTQPLGPPPAPPTPLQLVVQSK